MTTMRLIISVFAGLLLAISPVLALDEIILNSGKTLRGRITSETESVYKIKVGAKMLLSVSKDDVSDVIRDTPAAPPASQRMSEPPVAESAPPAAPEAPAAVSAPARAADDAEAPLPDGATRRQIKAGAATVNLAFIQNTYDVTGKTLDDVVASITDPKTGTGFPGRLKKRASKTDWRLRWYGKSNAGGTSWEELVIGSTVTTTQPVWIVKGERSTIQENRWKVFARQRAEVEAKHIAIIEETLENFALSASNLVAADEVSLRAQTAELLSEIRGRGDNRRKGLDRRIEEPRPKYLLRRKLLSKN